MSIKQQHRSLATLTSSPCLELVQENRTNIAALQEIWVRSFVPFLKRYSPCTTKPEGDEVKLIMQ